MIWTQLHHNLLSAIMANPVEDFVPQLIRYQENDVEFRA